MRRVALLSSIVALSVSPLHAQSRGPGQWNLDHAVLGEGTLPSSDGIALTSGMATRPDLRIKDGVIEYDLAPPTERFAGVSFRMRTSADYEIVYFRPSEDGTRWAFMQYQPVFQGETTWQLYHGAGSEAPVPPSLAGKDLHVRLVLSGTRLDVYVGDDSTPALRVPRLVQANAEGEVGFWVAPGIHAKPTPTVIRHLRVDRGASVSVASVPLPTHDALQLTVWQLSERMPNDSIVPPLALPEFVASGTGKWISADADPSGLINLNRQLGNAAGAQKTNVFGGAGWGIAYARLRIVSDREQTRRLSFSYSDGIGVYVNGKRVFAGRNDSDSRYQGYLGIVGSEVDGVDLSLPRGTTDVVLAVTDKAFGWGFRARLDSLEGISFENGGRGSP
jgi:hypothetical protein